MKRIIFIVGGVLVLASGLWLTWPCRFTISREVVIKVSVFDAGPQLTDVANWPHWYPDAVRHTFVITANNPAAVVAKVDNSSYLSVAAMPEHDVNYTRIRATRIISLGEWIGGIRPGGEMEVGLGALKKYLEDPVTHYGFEISIQPVKDTLIMTKRDTVAPDQVNARFAMLQQQLLNYLGKHRVLSSSFDLYMVNEPVKEGRILVAAGIPVSRPLPDGEGVELLKFPANGRLLVGRYHGPFSALPDLRRAMDKYMQDQHLMKVALPFMKGQELYYPIY